MQTTAFQEAVEAVARDDRRYHPEAYLFLRDSLDATLKRRKKAKGESGGHVAAPELVEGFRLHAIHEFGPMAMTVLDYWGVRSCEDVGQMVFNLVNAGVFGKTEEDTPESFAGGFDFHSAFVVPFKSGKFPLNAPTPDSVRGGE
ncbi:MAG: Minf_1886 family protein [Verrucomicrobiae bacterium]